MERYEKIVLKAPEGMHYVANQGYDGELILELVSNIPMTSEENEDKFKYFVKITEQSREIVREWYKRQSTSKAREKIFMARVRQAIQNVDYDYWIATIEPSVSNGEIFYAEYNDVAVRFTPSEWSVMAEKFAPERGSRQGKLHELIIWYALRAAEKKWTLRYVASDSSSAGNYKNAPRKAGKMEKTGARECGGYRDGQGNTCKIVTVDDGYVSVGGHYQNAGDVCPVAWVDYSCSSNYCLTNSSGVVVLTK